MVSKSKGSQFHGVESSQLVRLAVSWAHSFISNQSKFVVAGIELQLEAFLVQFLLLLA